MSDKIRIRAVDTLKIHFTTMDKVYEVLDQDDECYKINDDRARVNWVPKRYFVVVEDKENA